MPNGSDDEAVFCWWCEWGWYISNTIWADVDEMHQPGVEIYSWGDSDFFSHIPMELHVPWRSQKPMHSSDLWVTTIPAFLREQLEKVY